jgi:UDP-N-acetylglucosamine acyltransferase
MADTVRVDPSAKIHPSAIIEDGAVIGAGCEIGPYCLIGPQARLARRVTLKSHVVIAGDTRIGEDTTIWPFASIGHQPQDLKFAGEASRLEIGDRNMIRESVTINPGTSGGGLVTRVGDDNLLMVNVHVGHDCTVGNTVVIANNVSLAGHVQVEDDVVIGGHAGIHQWCRIGRGAMIGVLAAVLGDVIPYGTVTGDSAKLAGLNLVGLKRRGKDKDDITGLRKAFKGITSGSGETFKTRVQSQGDAHPDNPLVQEVVAFVMAQSDRAFCQPDE